jgi:phage/plasmid-associated DNA primase
MIDVIEFRAFNDTVDAFVAQRLVRHAGERVLAGDIYRAFVQWAEAAGVEPYSATRFSMALKDRGFSQTKARYRFWNDVRLRPALAVVGQA